MMGYNFKFFDQLMIDYIINEIILRFTNWTFHVWFTMYKFQKFVKTNMKITTVNPATEEVLAEYDAIPVESVKDEVEWFKNGF